MGASQGRTAPTNTGAGPCDRTATSFQASHPGADPSSQLQVLCRQPRREWEGQEEGEVWEERPLERSRLPCSARGRSAGKWDRGDQTRVTSSVINSGPRLLWARVYLQTLPVSRDSADHTGLPGRGRGRGSSEGWLPRLVCGFGSLCSPRSRHRRVASAPVSCLNAADKWDKKSIQQNTQEMRCFHYNSQPAMPGPLPSDNPLLLKVSLGPANS